MTWNTITLEDLSTYLLDEQLHAISTFGPEATRQNCVQQILEDVTAHIRAEIATRYPNQLHPNGKTIPVELKAVAAHLAIEALITRLPGLSLTADQVRHAQASRHLLERVARGNFRVSLPIAHANSGDPLEGKVPAMERLTRALGKLTRTMLEGL